MKKKKWKKLKSIGMVHKVLKQQDGRQTEEYRYYICSINADAEEFERAATGEWKTACTGSSILPLVMIKTGAWQKPVQKPADYENGIEKMLSLLDIDSIKN